MNLEAMKTALVDGILAAVRARTVGELAAELGTSVRQVVSLGADVERPLWRLAPIQKKSRKRQKSRPSSHYPTPAQAKQIVDATSAKLTGSKKTGFTLKTEKRDFHHYRKDRLVRRAKEMKLSVADLTTK